MNSLDQTTVIHPLQNRVDPYGRLIRTQARGTWMGNRGLIHNEFQQIVRNYRLKAWITCKLKFKNWHRMVMRPGRYTELFFLDEASSFSAGHRPCAECRREDYNRFKDAWIKGNPSYGFNMKTHMAQIDEIIHRERVDKNGEKVTYMELLDVLPAGTVIEHGGNPFMILELCRVAAWTPSGYQEAVELPHGINTIVLTPRSIVNAFRAGYSLE